MSFETALAERIEEMADACTRCGKCVEVCPSVEPAGIEDTAPQAVIGGLIDILRGGGGSEASRRWAQSCVMSGECVRACDYGVNPRFLLAMARVAIKRADQELPARRRRGHAQAAARRHDAVPLAALPPRPGAARPARGRIGERRHGRDARRAHRARLCLLHRLQRAEDAAYRAAGTRHHGPARHPLSRARRTQPLLRHHAPARR
jgi:ferredoxin